MNRLVSCLAVLSLLATSALSAQTSADEALIQQFYPDRLVADFATWSEAGDELPRFADSDRLLDPITGKETLVVAAYSNGVLGAVRVIDLAGTTPRVIDEPSIATLGGGRPAVSAFDVDGDGREEVLVSYAIGAGTRDWLFRWTGGHLVLASPATTDENGVVRSTLANADFIDADGDGTYELITHSPLSDPPFIVYKLTPSGPQQIPPFSFYSDYARIEGGPTQSDMSFTAKAGSYVLKIANGDRTGVNLMTSAEVRVNGTVVAKESDFKKKQRVMTFPVTLAAQNTISVSLRGAPGTQFTLTITKAQ